MLSVRSRAAAAAALLALAGCGAGDKPSGPEAARAATEDFAHAFGKGSGSRACELLTTSAQAAFVKRLKVSTGAANCQEAIIRVHSLAGKQVTDAFSGAKATNPKVTGTTATVTLTASGHATTVRLVKEGGDWKLNGVPGI